MVHLDRHLIRYTCLGAVLSLTLLGCTKPKETTAIGSAAGGAIGAGLGAIIGNQTGNAGSGLAIGAVAGAATGALIGNALQVQQEAVRSQDEAIMRQERTIAAQRTEIAELRNLNPDIVEQKRIALQKRGPAPTTSYGTRTAITRGLQSASPTKASSDPLARLDMRAYANASSTPSTLGAKAQSARSQKQSHHPSPSQSKPRPAQPTLMREGQAPVVGKKSSAETDSADACSDAEKERSSAQSATESSDKLFHLRRALRLCPNNARVHHELGQVYASMERKSDAAHEFKQALEIDPSYAPAKQSLEQSSSQTTDDVKF